MIEEPDFGSRYAITFGEVGIGRFGGKGEAVGEMF